MKDSTRQGIYLFGALFLASGGALLTYIGTGISMSITLAVIVILFFSFGRIIFRRLAPERRLFLSQRLRMGAVAGVIATLAYDVCRFILIKLTGIHFWPFDIFRIFGQALVGPNQNPIVTQALGLAFHVMNGVGFAIAYTIWFAPKGIWWGMGYALVLEALMVSVYPGWLEMKALKEFLEVSIFGHLVYGGILGYFAKRWTASPVNSPKYD